MESIPTLAQTLQVDNTTRLRALNACDAQARQWGIALPDGDPLVMDFGLGRFDQVGLIEFWIANEVEAGYCGKYMYVADGQMCPRHHHRFKHETFFVLHGELRVGIGDRTIVLAAGRSLGIPNEQPHDFTGVGNSLMLELSMPCDVHDNHFEHPQTMRWLNNALNQTAL